MKISAKCDYACKALLELSLHYGEKELTQIHKIAKNRNIPEKYLVQILIQLKGAGLVDSVRGKEGGYYLKKPPGKTTLGDVIREIDGDLLSVGSLNESSLREHEGKSQNTLGSIWNEVRNAISDTVDNITFEDIRKRDAMSRKALIYNI